DFIRWRTCLQLLDGGIIPEELQSLGHLEMIGIFLMQHRGNLQPNAHRARQKAVGYPYTDAAAMLARIEPAYGNERLAHKMNARQSLRVEALCNLFAVDPWSAKLLERRFRTASDGNASILQNFQPWIENGALHRAQIRRRREPLRPGAFKE